MQLELGATYVMQNGEHVKMVREENVQYPGHRTIQDEKGCNWYNRENNSGRDNGRVTGTPHDYSYPKNIKRVDGAFAKVSELL